MTKKQDTTIKYVNMLPPELVRYIKEYLPISVIKTVRKLHEHELPINYLICKDLNDYFYKKFLGFGLTINSCKWNISMLQNKKIQNSRTVFNPFSVDFWQTPFTTNTSIDKEIMEKENSIQIYKSFRDYYKDYYRQTILHMRNYKIIEI